MTLYVRRFATLAGLLAVSILVHTASAGDEGQKDCGQKATCQKGINGIGACQKNACQKDGVQKGCGALGCTQKACGGCAQKGGGLGMGLLGCVDCGVQKGCNQVCRLVKKPLKKEITCYKCECDVVCLPGPTPRGCRNVAMVNCDADKGGCQKGCGQKGCGSCSPDQKVFWFDWIADGCKGGKGGIGAAGIGSLGGMLGCGHSRTVKKLMKKTEEVEVKCGHSYEWEVCNMCKGCEKKYDKEGTSVEPEADVPPPPAIDAQLLYGKPIVERMASTPAVRWDRRNRRWLPDSLLAWKARRLPFRREAFFC
jgi:hypothetical protein